MTPPAPYRVDQHCRKPGAGRLATSTVPSFSQYSRQASQYFLPLAPCRFVGNSWMAAPSVWRCVVTSQDDDLWRKEYQMPVTTGATAADAGTVDLGGDITVNRLGFGAMRITGRGIWGDPPDRDDARAVLRRAIELGVNFIDTADSYGPHVSEELIAEALHPYPDDLVIATKGGLERSGPGEWPVNGRPEHLKQVCDDSLRRLRLEQIPLYQQHRPDPSVPYDETIGALVELKEQGKIRHIGLSNVDEGHLRTAQAMTPIVSVQNRYNVRDRGSESMLDLCEQEQIAFLPYSPVQDFEDNAVVAETASRHGVTVMQVLLAWLLARSPVMLPIPGTGSVAHLEENTIAATIELDPSDVAAISASAA